MATRQAERTTQTTENGEGGLEQVLRNTEAAMARPEFVQMRMENDAIMAECRARPRDYEAIKAELEAQIKAFPGMAEEAIYSKPVGKDKSGKMQFARGLSIRAAELLSEAYGYNRVRSDVTIIDADHVKVESAFLDFQRLRIWQDGGVVSAWYRSFNGSMVRHAEDRFLSLVVKAEASRRVREVILRSVNAGLKAWFLDLCERTLGNLLDDKAVKKIVDAFATKGVGIGLLEDLIGRPQAMSWTEEDRKHLQGIWNSVQEGDTTIEEVFGKKKEQSAPSVSTTDLTSPKLAEQPKEAPKTEAKETKIEEKVAEQKPEPTKEQPEQTSPADEQLAFDAKMKIIREDLEQALKSALGDSAKAWQDRAAAIVKDIADIEVNGKKSNWSGQARGFANYHWLLNKIKFLGSKEEHNWHTGLIASTRFNKALKDELLAKVQAHQSPEAKPDADFAEEVPPEERKNQEDFEEWAGRLQACESAHGWKELFALLTKGRARLGEQRWQQGNILLTTVADRLRILPDQRAPASK